MQERVRKNSSLVGLRWRWLNFEFTAARSLVAHAYMHALQSRDTRRMGREGGCSFWI